MSIIEVKNLHRTYITHTGILIRKKKIIEAVKDISFSVEKGETFGLLGQNGAGKTTTIKILTTLLAPTSGTAKVLGFNTFGEEKHIRRRINFIFGGELGVYRRLTARDNLIYFANLYQLPAAAARSRIGEVLEIVGLSNAADKRVETYSKGMIQRLQIARGLINNPEILFMDEPTVGLDPVGAKMLRNIIKQMKEQKRTVLLTTHYLYEADELCDRIAILKDGKMLVLDTPKGIKQATDTTKTLEIISAKQFVSVEQCKRINGVISVQSAECDSGFKSTIKYSCGNRIDSQVVNLFADTDIISVNHPELSLEDAYIKLMEEKK